MRLPSLAFRHIHIHAAPAARVVDKSDDPESVKIRAEWDSLSRMSREGLEAEFQRSHRVSTVKGVPKQDLVAGIMEARHGAKRLAKAFDARNHLGEKEYNTYAGWRAAAKAAGATRFEGDMDIAHAMGPNGGVGEWDGEKGSVYSQTQDAELPDAHFRNMGVEAKKDGESEAQLRVALRVIKASPAQTEIALATYARAKTGSVVMSDVGLTEWKVFPYATYEKLEVGKNYKMGEKKFTVLEKSLGDGGKNAVGMSNGQPMAKIRWRDAEPSSYLGKLVKFKIPSLNGPMKVAGTVKLILPDGRLEVKSQNHGYHKVAISELVE